MDKPRGFTIVEMLIVILIMGIMATGGYPLLMGYAQEVRLEQEARTIFEDLCLTRESAVTSGQGTSTVNFLPAGGGNPGNPFTEYELVAPNGENIRHALMDDFDAASGRWRRQLGTHSVCIVTTIPNPLPGSNLGFDSRGNMTSPANQQVRLDVKFFYANQIQDSVGTWTIEIASGSSQITLRQEQ